LPLARPEKRKEGGERLHLLPVPIRREIHRPSVLIKKEKKRGESVLLPGKEKSFLHSGNEEKGRGRKLNHSYYLRGGGRKTPFPPPFLGKRKEGRKRRMLFSLSFPKAWRGEKRRGKSSSPPGKEKRFLLCLWERGKGKKGASPYLPLPR